MVIEEVLCMRTNFNEELEELRRSVIQMGKSCRESIRSTCGCFPAGIKRSWMKSARKV